MLHDGVLEGRRTVENVTKYILMGASSNLGNMFSMAGAALFLPFLPMLPTQVLLNNLLYDLSEVGVPFDNVDAETVRRPASWDLKFIERFMLSAEAGDDGQTGRGNRANGLITPCRPMTLEALAGKNPVTHVGKLYNAAASRLAAAIVAEVPGITEAECYLVSQIGVPVDRPRIAHLRVRCQEGVLSSETEDRIRAVAEREISGIPSLWKSFLTQTISVA